MCPLIIPLTSNRRHLTYDDEQEVVPDNIPHPSVTSWWFFEFLIHATHSINRSGTYSSYLLELPWMTDCNWWRTEVGPQHHGGRLCLWFISLSPTCADRFAGWPGFQRFPIWVVPAWWQRVVDPWFFFSSDQCRRAARSSSKGSISPWTPNCCSVLWDQHEEVGFSGEYILICRNCETPSVDCCPREKCKWLKLRWTKREWIRFLSDVKEIYHAPRLALSMRWVQRFKFNNAKTRFVCEYAEKESWPLVALNLAIPWLQRGFLILLGVLTPNQDNFQLSPETSFCGWGWVYHAIFYVWNYL